MSENLSSRQIVQGVAAVAGVTALGAAVYHHFKPETTHDGGENYFDLITNLDPLIREAIGEDVEYVMLGGGASAALMNAATELDVEGRRIITPSNIRKDQYRKTNGLVADIDLLVLSTDPTMVEKVRAALEVDPDVMAHGTLEEQARERAKPGAHLKLGVTGLRSAEEYNAEPTSFAGKIVKLFKQDWVSHRVESENGDRALRISDVHVRLPAEYFEPWLLELKGGETIPVLHPLVQVLCYLSRASHGIRPRDIEKVTAIMNQVGDTFGATLAWGKKQQTASLSIDGPVNKGVAAAISFSDQKNNLRLRETLERQGPAAAIVLAGRIALHRQLDTRPIFVQFGQGGWLYDNFLSRLNGESQKKLSRA